MSEDVELGNIELKKKEEPQVDKKKVKTDVSKTEKKIGVVMVGLFILLIFLVVFIVRLNQGGIERVYFEYNGIDFTPSKTGVGFDMKFFVGDAQYPTLMTVRNDPRELENISINGEEVREIFSDKGVVYITEDPFDNLTGRTLVAANELAMPFSLLFQMEVDRSLVGLLDFKSSGGREERPRWVRFPHTSAILAEKGPCHVRERAVYSE